jgi:hypothetical protein
VGLLTGILVGRYCLNPITITGDLEVVVQNERGERLQGCLFDFFNHSKREPIEEGQGRYLFKGVPALEQTFLVKALMYPLTVARGEVARNQVTHLTVTLEQKKVPGRYYAEEEIYELGSFYPKPLLSLDLNRVICKAKEGNQCDLLPEGANPTTVTVTDCDPDLVRVDGRTLNVNSDRLCCLGGSARCVVTASFPDGQRVVFPIAVINSYTKS